MNTPSHSEGVTPADLDKARRQHMRELRILQRMDDNQFEAFKANFSLSMLDPALSRSQSMDLLRQMLITNMSLRTRIS